jgi:hypothetical protein
MPQIPKFVTKYFQVKVPKIPEKFATNKSRMRKKNSAINISVAIQLLRDKENNVRLKM